MGLTEILAEYYYLKDKQIDFNKADNTTRGKYFMVAQKNLPHILSGYFCNDGKLQSSVRGCIKDFINVHGNIITLQNYDSLARRIVASIKGSVGNNEHL
jgi:hypothetical protein